MARRHPVLLSEAVGVDGTPRYGLRVFCDVRLHSVPLDVCLVCPSFLSATGNDLDGTGCVRCSPREETVPASATPTGRAIHRGVVAVDEAVLVRDIVALFAERRLRLVVVTDVEGRATGVVHESQLVREIQTHNRMRSEMRRLGWNSVTLESAADLMLPVATVTETVPLRTAMTAMTTARQRQLLVIDTAGVPIGVLFDVDALHVLYGHDDQLQP